MHIGTVFIRWVQVAFVVCQVETMANAGPLEARFLSRTRQLIFEGRRSGEGYFSPDGKWMVFQSERDSTNPFYQIYTLDLESGDTHRLSPGIGKTTCAFFRPGSDEILFASTHLDPEALVKQRAELDFRASGKSRRYSWDYDAQMELFVARRDGSGLRRLTKSLGYDAEGSFSPDGKWIVFCSLRDAYPAEKLNPEDRKRLETDPSWFGEIYLMKADGSQPRRLTHTPGYDGGPFFTPDGKRIVWRRFDASGVNADVYTMRLDGTDARRLTDFGAMSWAPYFHPSGRYAIFTANKLGFENFELFIVDAAGEREPVRVTDTDGFDGLPVFSPDGQRLSWTSNRTPEKQSQIFIADWNHVAALAALDAAPHRAKDKSVDAAALASGHPEESAHSGRGGRIEKSEASGHRIQELRHHVEFLASPLLEGRATGAAGAAKAADYIASQLSTLGLKPLPGLSGFEQPFDFTASNAVVAAENHLETISTRGTRHSFSLNSDFRPLSFTANHSVTGEVVFAGYGLVAPGKLDEKYDSYSGLNVSNKIVLVLRYVPEGVESKRRQELNRYAGLRYKAMMARERGALALLVVAGPSSPHAGELVDLASDGSLSGSSIAAASVSGVVAKALFEAAGRDLTAIQSQLDLENPHAELSFAIPGMRLALSTGVQPVRHRDRNILAMIPPSAGVRDYVLVGAHYDHLGTGDHNSLQHKGEENQFHLGADDNASGVAAVLSLAQAFQTGGLPKGVARRGLIIALWSGEELGLLGSAHFAEHPPIALTQMVAYVNFDMVGRLRENKLVVQGAGSSSRWRALMEKRNVAAGFTLSIQDDPYLPTDVTSLYPKGIPAINFFTGSHEDYHRPSDTADKINYEGLDRITQMAQAITKDLLNPTEAMGYVKVERSGTLGGSREGLRAYLGTIPDYAAEVKGVRLSGVRGGSPADKAGLKGGDTLVGFAGQKIANIYDYTYALDAVRIGQPVDLEVLRDGKQIRISVTPEARK